MDNQLVPKKKWYQLEPSEHLSHREQVEICVLIFVVVCFALTLYHYWLR